MINQCVFQNQTIHIQEKNLDSVIIVENQVIGPQNVDPQGEKGKKTIIEARILIIAADTEDEADTTIIVARYNIQTQLLIIQETNKA